jgi:Spy/CpxP family protein refolding chaperone
MKNWKSILLLVLVFCAGLAAGIVGTRIFVRRAVQQAMVHPEKMQILMERNLTRRLQLDNGQQAKLHAVLTDTRQQLNDLHKQYQPQAVELWRGTDSKISAFLTPEQQAKFEKMKEQGWPALRRLRAGIAP